MNHRMFWVERDLKGHLVAKLVPTPLPHAGTLFIKLHHSLNFSSKLFIIHHFSLKPTFH